MNVHTANRNEDGRRKKDGAWSRGIIGDPWRRAGTTADPLARQCATLLLGQDIWIQRRVENISFTSQGTTRRQISFDFLLPKDKMIHWRCYGEERDLIAVPLTFLGKGDLIHADARTASGETVPLTRLTENKEFSAYALDYCCNGLQEIQSSGRFRGDRPFFTAVRDYCVNRGMSEKKANYAVHDAHAFIAGMSVDERGIIQRIRELIADWLRALDGNADGGNALVKVGEMLDLNSEKDWLRTQSQCTLALLTCLQDYVFACIQEHRDDSTTMPRESDSNGNPIVSPWRKVALHTYLLLLSTCCDMYPCTVLLPRKFVENRTIVKLSFDSSYQESKWDRYAKPASEQLELSFQTASAQSTHIEINPIAGSRIAMVEQNLKGDQPTNMRSSVSAGRVHISTQASRMRPLLHLRLTLMSNVPSILANIGWSALFLACALINAAYAWGKFNAAEEYYNPQNVLAALAVFLTLWVARRINTINHSLSQDLNRYPSVIISANLTVASLSCLCCGLLYQQERHDTVLQWIVLCCALFSALLSGIAAHGWIQWLRYYNYRCDASHGRDGMRRRVSFIVDTGTVPLPHFNAHGSPKSKATWRHPCQAVAHWLQSLPIFKDNPESETNSSLYPADHGPYSVIEDLNDPDQRKGVMLDKFLFVKRQWKVAEDDGNAKMKTPRHLGNIA